MINITQLHALLPLPPTSNRVKTGEEDRQIRPSRILILPVPIPSLQAAVVLSHT